LTGSPPYVAKSGLDTIMKHCTAPIPTLKEASLGKTFSPALESVARKVLAKDPNDRYQTMQELKAAVNSAISTRGGSN
ncbi:hypothetical protein ABTD73_21785, partial [Acinetobacter baumannii]